MSADPPIPFGDPLLGEIRLFASSRPPRDWVRCEGQPLNPQNHPELFALMGTKFGGDGVTSFLLPDLRGRVPVHAGDRHAFASTAGTEKVTLDADQLPQHTHGFNGSSEDAASQSIEGTVPAVHEQRGTLSAYGKERPLGALKEDMLDAAGGGQAHENMQPFVPVSFVMATSGRRPAPGPRPIPPPTESPFVGEIRMFALGYAPVQFMPCDGRPLPASQHRAMFEVLGTAFGGSAGTFQLPLFEDRVPVGAGQGPGLTDRPVGRAGGAEQVKLTEDQLPAHEHRFQVSRELAVERHPEALAFAVGDGVGMYGRREGYRVPLAEEAVDPAGGGKGHANMQPYLPIGFYIAYQGLYPF